jgi:subtilisin family serine protease
LVGLPGTLSIEASPASLARLTAARPDLAVEPTVPRYLLDCGDGRCDPDEAATASRSSSCSLDCGVPPPRAAFAELANSPQATLVGAAAAWPLSTGAGVEVCIVDSGYDSGADSRHPDRPENLVGGRSFPGPTGDFAASSNHGTHVAGIVAAPQNAVGMVGIAPAASIRVYKVFQQVAGQLTARSDDIIAAIDAALADGCQILNLSFGGGQPSELEQQAVARAYQSGLLLVAAAGNAEDAAHGTIRTARFYPAAYPEVIAVAATTLGDGLADFSSTGPAVGLAAPGVGIYSSVPVGTGDREVSFSCQQPGQPPLPIAASLPPAAPSTALALADLKSCGFGSPAELAACAPAGRLALIQRGPAGPGQTAIPFADKLRSAQLAGAVGVVLYNHRAGDPAVAGGLLANIDLGAAVAVPVVALAAGDGEQLARLAAGGPLGCTLSPRLTSWAVLDGTSMATPVVSGIAALLWARPRHPQLTNVELRQLLAETAIDLGAAGRDDAYGWGRVDVGRALAQDRPRARCGDGQLDPASELCDTTAPAGVTCPSRGFDPVSGTAPTCNPSCSGVDDSGCRCLPGRLPFQVATELLRGYDSGGQTGTLAFYRIAVAGQPVSGVIASATITPHGIPSPAPGQVRQRQSGPSPPSGLLPQFFPERGSGLAAGDYDVTVVLTPKIPACHDPQPLPPFSLHVRS